jgi:hypothetical protein
MPKVTKNPAGGKRTGQTTIRKAMKQTSPLQQRVENGLGAMKKAHKARIDSALQAKFDDSLDIDEAFREGHEQENRWDYLLGYMQEDKVIALEPHSAKDDEVATVIRKRAAALAQMKDHLEPDARISSWLWVASKDVDFANTEKTRIRLDSNGIRFVGKIVKARHLD